MFILALVVVYAVLPAILVAGVAYENVPLLRYINNIMLPRWKTVFNMPGFLFSRIYILCQLVHFLVQWGIFLYMWIDAGIMHAYVAEQLAWFIVWNGEFPTDPFTILETQKLEIG